MQIDKSKKFLKFFDKISEPRKIDFLVLHHIEAKSVDHAIAQLCEHQVSSHFLIDEAEKIFELVDENDVAYHAGVSFWRGIDGLNKSSIGVEFINSSPFEKRFEAVQMSAGVELCKYLIKKYHIEAQNIVGHSDIAYSSETGLLDRKQDPSHLFDWKFLAENGVGIFSEITLNNSVDHALAKMGDKNNFVLLAKEKLKKFGYLVKNMSDEFDDEMQALTIVFNRRFSPEKFSNESDVWHLSSMTKLNNLLLKSNF